MFFHETREKERRVEDALALKCSHCAARWFVKWKVSSPASQWDGQSWHTKLWACDETRQRSGEKVALSQAWWVFSLLRNANCTINCTVIWCLFVLDAFDSTQYQWPRNRRREKCRHTKNVLEKVNPSLFLSSSSDYCSRARCDASCLLRCFQVCKKRKMKEQANETRGAAYSNELSMMQQWRFFHHFRFHLLSKRVPVFIIEWVRVW